MITISVVMGRGLIVVINVFVTQDQSNLYQQSSGSSQWYNEVKKVGKRQIVIEEIGNMQVCSGFIVSA